MTELAAERKAARLVRREMGMEGEGEYSDEIQDISDSPEIICEDEDNYEGMDEEEVCVYSDNMEYFMSFPFLKNRNRVIASVLAIYIMLTNITDRIIEQRGKNIYMYCILII